MRILVLGGTGAMGVHLVRRLAELGHTVYVTSRSSHRDAVGISFIRGDAKASAFLSSLLEERWGAIVDFMVWSTDEFAARVEGFLAATDQYVFLSSYRVYADSPVITEDSPRLLDVSDDEAFLATDDYALSKARSENRLSESDNRNWTIVRPAITYDSSGRFQLGVHEAGVWLWRALHGIPVPLPGAMLDREATMTWGGDAARMIAALIGNERALGEMFTVATSEHHRWADVVAVYRSVVPDLKIVPVDLEDFVRERGDGNQIRRDRMFDRIIDNAKVLEATGMRQEDLVPLDKRLASELESFLSFSTPHCESAGIQAHMDRLVGGWPSFGGVRREMGAAGAAKYMVRRLGA